MSIVSVDNIQPIGSGTSVTVNKSVTLESGNTNITGVCTATSFVGSGANLTGLPSQVTITGNADNRVITGGSGTNLNGESGFTFNGSLASIINSSGPTLELTTNTNAADASLRLHEGTTGSTTNGGGMFYSGADNKLHITCGTNSTTKRITITRDDGLIGIATDAPSAAFLDIASSQPTDSLRMRRLSSDSNVASNWSMKPYGGHLYFREGGSTDKIQFMNGGDLNIMDGNLRVASGHGIDFNATSDHGSATPASELLDDYEEGSWTPVLESTSTNPTISSYSKQQGLYTKIGNVVHLFCFIDIAAGNIGGTLTGDGKITGLPFVISNNPSSTDVHGSACDNLKSIPNTFSSQRNNAMLYFPPGQDYLAIHQYNTTNPIYQTGWGMSQIGNGNRFKWAWTGQYRTDQT